MQLDELPKRERRGSRARCILLTDGARQTVAARLHDVFAPIAGVEPMRHAWMPQGIAAPTEAKLGEASALLSADRRTALTDWWLAVQKGANTPNWDIACTATVGRVEGLVLVEAKAHSEETKDAGKPPGGNLANNARIRGAIDEASRALNQIAPGWSLSNNRSYQLCNRFAWAWKTASLGIPTVLVYLGFLGADEMRDQGEPFESHNDWEQTVRRHAHGLVPNDAWDRTWDIAGTPMRAIIRSIKVDLPPNDERR